MGFRAGEALPFFVEYTAWNAPCQLIGACLIYLSRPLASPRPPREHTPHTYSHRTPAAHVVWAVGRGTANSSTAHLEVTVDSS